MIPDTEFHKDLAERFIKHMTFPCSQCASTNTSVVSVSPADHDYGHWRFTITLLCGGCDHQFSIRITPDAGPDAVIYVTK